MAKTMAKTMTKTKTKAETEIRELVYIGNSKSQIHRQVIDT
jgi:hypothetical protein